MAFVSDAQRKHFFANAGGSGGGDVPSFPVGSAGGYWHSITVCGVEKTFWVDDSEPQLTADENRQISEKEDRKAYDMAAITGGGWK